MAGLKDADVHLSNDAIEELIKSYCRESGVRNLKKQIEKVYRKSALKIVQDLGDDGLVEPEALTADSCGATRRGRQKKSTARARARGQTLPALRRQ